MLRILQQELGAVRDGRVSRSQVRPYLVRSVDAITPFRCVAWPWKADMDGPFILIYQLRSGSIIHDRQFVVCRAEECGAG